MMVTNGLNTVRDLLTGGSAASIAWLDIGDDDTTPALSDTALTNEYGETPSETEPAYNKVMFQIDVAAGEGNGGGTVNYVELGLLTVDDGVLFSRQIFASKTKTAAIAFKVQVVVEVIS